MIITTIGYFMNTFLRSQKENLKLAVGVPVSLLNTVCVYCNTQEESNIDTNSDTDIDSDSESEEIRRLRRHMLIEFDDGSD